MQPICRINDMGIGVCSVCRQTVIGRVITGSMDTNVEGQPVARLTDYVLSGCNHSFGIIQLTSQTVNVNNLGVARVNDMFIGSYMGQLILGATNTNAG